LTSVSFGLDDLVQTTGSAGVVEVVEIMTAEHVLQRTGITHAAWGDAEAHVLR
jgi:hypothetical protein